MLSTLGTGDALKNKLNAKLAAQGLKPAIGVTNPVSGALMSTGSTVLPGWSSAWGMLLVLVFTLHLSDKKVMQVKQIASAAHCKVKGWKSITSAHCRRCG